MIQIQLPVTNCPRCRKQLPAQICVERASGSLICGFCALRMGRAGQGAGISPVYPPAGWAGTGLSEPLDPFDAIALLVRFGAVVIEDEAER